MLQRFESGWVLGWCSFKVLLRAEVPIVEVSGKSSLVHLTTAWELVFTFLLTKLRNIAKSEREQ